MKISLASCNNPNRVGYSPLLPSHLNMAKETFLKHLAFRIYRIILVTQLIKFDWRAAVVTAVHNLSCHFA